MGVVIAAEGPDKAGKSTFIKALRELKPFDRWPVMKMDVPPALFRNGSGPGPEIETMARAWGYGLLTMKKMGMSFIMDRCYVSSYVYNYEFHRGALIDYIHGLAHDMHPIIAYVRAPIEVLLQRLEKEGDPVGGRERLISLWQSYERWWLHNPFGDRIVPIHSDMPAIEMAVRFADSPLVKGI